MSWSLLRLIQNINHCRCNFNGNTQLSIQNKSGPQNKNPHNLNGDLVGKWRHKQTCIASTSIAFSPPGYYLQTLSLMTASLPSCSLGALPQHTVLLSLSLRGDAQLPELKLLHSHEAENRAQVSQLHCKAQHSVVWQGSAQSLFGGPGLYLQALDVW